MSPGRRTSFSVDVDDTSSVTSSKRSATPKQKRTSATSMSPGRTHSPERLTKENVKLRSDLEAANEARMRDEAERTLAKVEEVERLTAENERLRAQLAASQVTVTTLKEVVTTMESDQATIEQLTTSLTEARADAVKAQKSLASNNKHAVGLCQGCGNIYHLHNKLESATYRSKSPRFGTAPQHASLGVKVSSNPHVRAGSAPPGPGAHLTQRDNHGSLYGMGFTAVETYSTSVSGLHS